MCAAVSWLPSNFSSGKSQVLMVVTGISSPAFMISTSRGWTKRDCTITEPDFFKISPNDKQSHSTNVIQFEGRFYALSSQGTLAVVEEVGIDTDRFEIVVLGKTRAAPSVPSKDFRGCLVESDGETLLVFLISGKTMDVVDDLEVFQLCFSELVIKMRSLRGRTLFLGSHCCVSVRASKVGCGANSAYLTQKVIDIVGGNMTWKSGSCLLSPAWSEANSTTKSFKWDEPVTDVLAK